MNCCDYYRNYQYSYRNHPDYQYNDYSHYYHQENPYNHQTQYYQPTSAYYHQYQHSYYNPDYVYNPKEARMRKAIRDQTREANRLYSGKISSSPTKRAHSGQLLQPNESPQSRRMLESPKGKMPSGGAGGYNPPHWPGDGVNQYCGGGSEGFMDIPYQAHDGGVYSNIVNGHSQSQWYPYAMQQDGGTMQYAQAWPPHGSPVGYSAQRMQYAQMQPSAHEPGQQPGFQNYEQPSEASQQQQQQQQAGVNVAKVSKRGDNAEPVQQTGSAAAGPSSFQGQPNTNVASTSNGSARRQANAAKPDAATTTSQQVKPTVKPAAQAGNLEKLPTFDQAFSGTEIGRYSHEGFNKQNGNGNGGVVDDNNYNLDLLYRVMQNADNCRYNGEANSGRDCNYDVDMDSYTFADYQKEIKDIKSIFPN